MLAPRSKPVENVPVNTESVPSASIFGSAKPVDTSQREREIEAKLAKEHDKSRDGSRDRDKRLERSEEKTEDNEKRNVSIFISKDYPDQPIPELIIPFTYQRLNVLFN